MTKCDRTKEIIFTSTVSLLLIVVHNTEHINRTHKSREGKEERRKSKGRRRGREKERKKRDEEEKKEIDQGEGKRRQGEK